jgi:hypothetical protein
MTKCGNPGYRPENSGVARKVFPETMTVLDAFLASPTAQSLVPSSSTGNKVDSFWMGSSEDEDPFGIIVCVGGCADAAGDQMVMSHGEVRNENAPSSFGATSFKHQAPHAAPADRFELRIERSRPGHNGVSVRFLDGYTPLQRNLWRYKTALGDVSYSYWCTNEPLEDEQIAAIVGAILHGRARGCQMQEIVQLADTALYDAIGYAFNENANASALRFRMIASQG